MIFLRIILILLAITFSTEFSIRPLISEHVPAHHIIRGGALSSDGLVHSRGVPNVLRCSRGGSGSQNKEELRGNLLKIGIPAFIQLTAEPLASLVDTAYLGRLGPEVLGGAGVAIAAHYSVSKLYNDPLLRTSTSLVASESATEENSVGSSVSSAILLAAAIGVLQMGLYFFFADRIINFMGVGESSSMHYSALSYLKIRALGSPAATVWLVSNGIFRGLGDTKTPLLWSIIFTIGNAVLDPIFIFTLGFGASGAAAGTAISQSISLIFLLRALNKKVPGGIDIFSKTGELSSSMKSYLSAGFIVFWRTVAKVGIYAFCAKQAAILGAVGAAAYNLTFQLGFATTQICESVAIACQTMIAKEVGGLVEGGDKERARSREVSNEC